jgi:hypothetical protein
MRASFVRLRVYEGARKRFRFKMCCLDMCVKSGFLPEGLVARSIASAVKLGGVDVLVPLEAAKRGEGTPAAFPIAGKVALLLGM